MRLFAFALALTLATNVAAADAPNPVVAVTGGQVQGRLLPSAGGAVFKGVPFAAPPVGALRWREPQPVTPWTGVRDAGAYSASCVQNIQGWNRQEATGNKEDCLYLNVWTPQWPSAAKKPVMFWIYGGGNSGGGASVDYFDGASLARKGVVVVTFNYRLGLLGFFAHPGLTAESTHHASGDYGLLDQLAALKWVHANIARFGGDPDNVTVFGQSAGAGNTAYLVASPLSKGLFQRAIQESSGGGLHDYPSLHEAEQAGERFAASLQAPAGTKGVAFLRSLPADQLQKAATAARGPAGPNTNTSLDGWFMPVNPRVVFAQGAAPAMPLLVGNNAQELGGPKPDAARKAVAEAFGVNADKALAFYGLTAAGNGGADPLYGPATIQIEADPGQRCPAVQQAIWQTAEKAPVYEYQFDRAIPPAPATRHTAEVPYVFGNLLTDGFMGGAYGDADRRISEQMQAYWTNFAKTGDPNGPGLPKWPKFEPGARPYLEFTDKGPVSKTGLRREICDLYMANIAHEMKALGH